MQIVAPLAGAWIEIELHKAVNTLRGVAPLAGAWIEIIFIYSVYPPYMSLPSRERGLKCLKSTEEFGIPLVAPLAGAWIEIYL